MDKFITIVFIAYGGLTGINDYHLSNGNMITCTPQQIEEYLKQINS